MDNKDNNDQPIEGAGYATPGEDNIIRSTSEAVPSPTRPSKERLQTPPARLSSIGETPGDANPALNETAGYEKGEVSTADLLRARETAEGQLPPTSGKVQHSHDQARSAAPLDYLNAPRADETLLASGPDVFGQDLHARQDWEMDREGTQASIAESGSGLPPLGTDIEEDIYEREEMHTPTETSDLDRLAPGMENNPAESDDD